MMGMTDAPYWFSWWIHFTIINTIVSVACVGILQINVNNYSNPIYLFLFIWLYGEAVFGQIIFMQAFFSSSKYAGIVATIVYFGTSAIKVVLANEDLSYGVKLVASLLPQAAIMQGAEVYANYECTGIGLNGSTAEVEHNNYSFVAALYMMALSAIIFTFLGLYFDKIIPSKFGKRRHPCFCVSPKFWGCQKQERRQQ
jgi:hypothetical protein